MIPWEKILNSICTSKTKEKTKNKNKKLNCVILSDFFKNLWKASAILKRENLDTTR